MAYLLIDGPRAGQLVEGLPTGYRFARKLDDRPFVEVVVQGIGADAAVWIDDATPVSPQSSG